MEEERVGGGQNVSDVSLWMKKPFLSRPGAMMDPDRHEAPEQTRYKVWSLSLSLVGLFSRYILPDSSFLAHILHISLHPNQNLLCAPCQASSLEMYKKKGGQRVPGGMQGSCSLTGPPRRHTYCSSGSEGIWLATNL